MDATVCQPSSQSWLNPKVLIKHPQHTHRASRSGKTHPEDKATRPLHTAEHNFMISIISLARSAVSLNNHVRVLQNNKKCEQKWSILQHLKASALDAFVSVEDEDFDTQLFLLIRSPVALILIKICAVWQIKLQWVTDTCDHCLNDQLHKYHYQYLNCVLLRVTYLWHIILVATAFCSISWRARETC